MRLHGRCPDVDWPGPAAAVCLGDRAGCHSRRRCLVGRHGHRDTRCGGRGAGSPRMDGCHRRQPAGFAGQYRRDRRRHADCGRRLCRDSGGGCTGCCGRGYRDRATPLASRGRRLRLGIRPRPSSSSGPPTMASRRLPSCSRQSGRPISAPISPGGRSAVRSCGQPYRPRRPGPARSAALVSAILAGLATAAVADVPLVPILVVVIVALSIAGQCGDLFESFVKRRFGAKDAGTIIPGHGGMMDRVDGLVFAGAVAVSLGFLHSGGSEIARGLIWW